MSVVHRTGRDRNSHSSILEAPAGVRNTVKMPDVVARNIW